MSTLLFREDAYLTTATAEVLASTPEGVTLDRPLFYPTSGGQPGDAGRLSWDGKEMPVATTRKGPAPDTCLLIPAEAADLPPIGGSVTQQIDWDLRYAHMRVHTALHLLSVVIPLGVTGGAIGAGKGRLDFLMPEPPEDKQAIEDALNALISRDLEVTDRWITDAELEANPGLVKTMSVQPPKGAGRVRLVRIGTQEEQIDLQPCGGTHVRRTGEIGHVTLGKIENKGKQNRRVNIILQA